MKKINSWESELWEYLDMGSELACTVYAKCRTRKLQNFCSCSIFGNLREGCNSKGCCKPFSDLKGTEDLPCHNTNAAFIETIKPGRVNELLEPKNSDWFLNS